MHNDLAPPRDPDSPILPPHPTRTSAGCVYNIDMLELTTEENGVLLGVKAVPGSSRTRLLGEWDGRAKIALAAPPEKGKANEALVTLLAELLSVRKRDVSVVAGHASPVKTIRIERVTASHVRAALQPTRS